MFNGPLRSLTIAASAALACAADHSALSDETQSHNSQTAGAHSASVEDFHQLSEVSLPQLPRARYGSPINIDTTKAVTRDLRDLEICYCRSRLHIENDGHQIKVNYDQGSYVKLNGEVYQLAQLHMHTPSEHIINGRRFSGELHLVHRSSSGKLFVVGVLLDRGRHNQFLDPILDNTPLRMPVGTIHLNQAIDAGQLIPQEGPSVRLEGSSTTKIGGQFVEVLWTVFTSPITLSAAQLSKLEAETESFSGNHARPLQDVGGRRIIIDPKS